MARCAADIPIQGVQGMVDRVEVDYLLEEVEAIVSYFGVREESDSCSASVNMLDDQCIQRDKRVVSYGHEMMDTSKMPKIMALLTLYVIR